MVAPSIKTWYNLVQLNLPMGDWVSPVHHGMGTAGMVRDSRSPGLVGALFGLTWTLICLVLVGVMIKAYSEMWGMPGILFGIFLPLSAPTFPFFVWYMTGGFPWLWTLGFLIAIGMGKMILTEPGA